MLAKVHEAQNDAKKKPKPMIQKIGLGFF